MEGGGGLLRIVEEDGGFLSITGEGGEGKGYEIMPA